MQTDRIRRTKKERDYLIQITNKYKLKTLENNSNRTDLFSYLHSNSSDYQANHNTFSSLNTHMFLRENEPTSKANNINEDMLSESLFNSEEYQIKFAQYKEKLDKRIMSIKEKFKQGELILLLNDVFVTGIKSINHINNKDNPLLCLISMMNQSDLYSFLNISKSIKTEVLNALSFEIQTFITNKFKEKSNNTLFDDYAFSLALTNRNEEAEGEREGGRAKQNKMSILLIIKAKIAQKKELLSKTFNIRYKSKYNCDKTLMINLFTFDVKNRPLRYWIMREYTQFHIDSLNKAYFQHVMQFAIGDYAEFTINIFTGKGLMNIRQLEWYNIKQYKSPLINCFEHTKDNTRIKEIGDINSMRYCELELLKSDWKDIHQMENSIKLIEIINKRFGSLFDMKDIVFDDVGYYIFKIHFIAKSSGLLGLEKEIGLKVKIIADEEIELNDDGNDSNQKEIVSNEVKKNNLIFDRKNELQLHIGDELVFYFSKNK